MVRPPRESIDGDVSVAKLASPCSLAVASDGAIYVGEGIAVDRAVPITVRLIHRGQVSTLARCLGASHPHCKPGLLLDEDKRLLYVSDTDSIRAIAVSSRAERAMAYYYPVMRTWWLVQAERAQMVTPLTVAATNNQGAEEKAKKEIRARSALLLLMRCPVVGVLARTLGFVFG